MGYIGNPSFQRIDAALKNWKNNQPVIAKVFYRTHRATLGFDRRKTKVGISPPRSLGDGKGLRRLSFYSVANVSQLITLDRDFLLECQFVPRPTEL
jgi:hypothetical protein